MNHILLLYVQCMCVCVCVCVCVVPAAASPIESLAAVSSKCFNFSIIAEMSPVSCTCVYTKQS